MSRDTTPGIEDAPSEGTDTDTVLLSATVDVRGLTPPRKNWVQGEARQTEWFFVRAFDGDTGDITDTNEVALPRQLETVSLHQPLDTSEMCPDKTLSAQQIARSLEYRFTTEKRAYREKHTE